MVAVAVAVRTRCPETPGEGAAKARPRSEGVDAASWAQHPRADADASVARDKSAVCMSAGRAYARTNLSEWLKELVFLYIQYKFSKKYPSIQLYCTN